MKRASSGLASIVALTAALAVSGPAIAAQSELGAHSNQPGKARSTGHNAKPKSEREVASISKGTFAHRTQGKRVEDITDKHLGELGAFEAKEAGQPTAK
ncbi:MAG: hypothetical protein WCA32_14080 [Chromatiaceae bacterium]